MKYTAAILAVNCLVFAAFVLPYVDDRHALYRVAMGDEVAGMAVSVDNLWPGIVAYMFGHAGAAHLIMNMLMLLMVGRGLEERAGFRLVIFYLVGGVLGAFAHMTYSGMVGHETHLIGASAAVSGVFGAAIAYRAVGLGTVFYFIIVLNVVPFVGVMTGLLPEDGVSYVSHIGGVVVGLILGACFVLAGCIRRKVWHKPGGPVDPDLSCRTPGRTGFYRASRTAVPDYSSYVYKSC